MTRILRCDREDFCLYTLVPLGIFLLGVTVNTAAVLLGAESTFAFLPIFLLLACALLGLSGGISALLYAFPLAVSFSIPRRQALSGVVVYLLAIWAVLAGLCTALVLVDHWYVYNILPLLFPGLEVMGDPLYELGVSYIIVAATLGVATGFLGGTAILRFGRKGGWALWGIYMAALLCREQIAWAALLNDWPYWVLVLLMLLGLSVWSLLHWDVRR